MTALTLSSPLASGFPTRIRQASPLLWRSSLVFLAAFVLCLVLQAVDGRQFNGISVWIKPAKFFLSVALQMLTLAWGISLLPEPTVDREVAAGALVSRPLAGIELKRPIGIVQRRGKELGKTARRFMQLLLKQSLSSRAIAQVAELEDENGAAEELAAEPSSLTEDSPEALPEEKVVAAAHAGS